MVCGCRWWWWWFVMCSFQVNAPARIARRGAANSYVAVRYLLWCLTCVFESHQTMWAFLLRPHKFANGSATIMICALLTGFATGARLMVCQLLTIYTCCHGLRLSVVVVICHVPLTVKCTGKSCASECSGQNCGCALPSVVPCFAFESHQVTW
jgi:hypothetical protein